MSNQRIVLFLLRLSIASVFLYAAIAATLQPDNWIGYIPPVVRKILSAQLLLIGFSLYELVLGVWILSDWKTMYAASLAALTLLDIIAANITQTDILFRDFAIFFAALALAVSGYQKRS